LSLTKTVNQLLGVRPDLIECCFDIGFGKRAHAAFFPLLRFTILEPYKGDKCVDYVTQPRIA
jgi:hypothetical protein